MLQKLENIYLGILRGVVLIISGGLLLGAIFFGLNALKVISGPPTFDPYTPEIEANTGYKQSLITQYQPTDNASERSTAEASPDNASPASQGSTEENPLQSQYEDVANLVDEFATEVTGETGWINKDFVINHIRTRAEAYNTSRLTQAYANDIVPYVRNVLQDEQVIDVADSQNLIDIVNEVLDDFDRQFDQALSAEDRRRNQAQREHAQGKVEGMQSLYIAGGTFGAFLFIVFLSIFIKIERNLRHLAELPSGRNKNT
ncbi:hypothetical protein [Vreelandella massiliensis]|uniref:hypothetical protein n=1 Tax=Vreelandella massiliensis TaxID=1816686 RepID=UPI00096A6D2A|nr:hypothetical protein [Halomonas massiliensis]